VEKLNMQFAAAVVTEEKPTQAMLAGVLKPFGPRAGAEAKWDRYVLGGRFSGRLGPNHIADAIKGIQQSADPDLHRGVDALQNGNLATFHWSSPPGVLIVDGQWLEFEPKVADFGDSLLVPFYLGDIDPSARVLSPEEMRLEDDWFERFYSILDGLPDDRWISIVDCRAPVQATYR
jgi:hypothetical protein